MQMCYYLDCVTSDCKKSYKRPLMDEKVGGRTGEIQDWRGVGIDNDGPGRESENATEQQLTAAVVP